MRCLWLLITENVVSYLISVTYLVHSQIYLKLSGFDSVFTHAILVHTRINWSKTFSDRSRISEGGFPVWGMEESMQELLKATPTFEKVAPTFERPRPPTKSHNIG